jgi:ferredoxin--NADP+ reductase
MVLNPSTQTACDGTNAAIVWRHDIAEGLTAIRVAPDSGPAPTFIPGQFATVALAKLGPDGRPEYRGDHLKLVRRAYSIASSADERGYLELLLTHVKEGRLTPRLFALDVGDRLCLTPKISGKFTLEEIERDKDLVMIATGTGLAPYMSMLRTHSARGDRPWRRFILLHSVRYREELAYQAEIEALARMDGSICYLPTVTREADDSPWEGLRGRVQNLLEADRFAELTGTALSPDNCRIFLCGNPQMIMAVEPELRHLGFTAEGERQTRTLHYERYW